jgi:hypothetical protein
MQRAACAEVVTQAQLQLNACRTHECVDAVHTRFESAEVACNSLRVALLAYGHTIEVAAAQERQDPALLATLYEAAKSIAADVSNFLARVRQLNVAATQPSELSEAAR